MRAAPAALFHVESVGVVVTEELNNFNLLTVPAATPKPIPPVPFGIRPIPALLSRVASVKVCPVALVTEFTPVTAAARVSVTAPEAAVVPPLTSTCPDVP